MAHLLTTEAEMISSQLSQLSFDSNAVSNT